MAVILSMTLLFSCNRDEEVVFEEDDDAISAEVLSQIKMLGFGERTVERVEGSFIAPSGYLVEGDIFISDEELNKEVAAQFLRVGDEEQYRTFNLVNTGSGVRTLTVATFKGNATQGMPNSFDTPVNIAIDRFNAENLRLRFQRIASSSWQSADIVLYRESGNFLAAAGFPSGGNPNRFIRMNTSAMGSFTTNARATVIAHEMGHCIGFRHTDLFDRSFSCGGFPVNEEDPPSGVGAVLIPGTPAGPDPSSWMLACAGSSTNRPFSANDRIALDFLY